MKHLIYLFILLSSLLANSQVLLDHNFENLQDGSSLYGQLGYLRTTPFNWSSTHTKVKSTPTNQNNVIEIYNEDDVFANTSFKNTLVTDKWINRNSGNNIINMALIFNIVGPQDGLETNRHITFGLTLETINKSININFSYSLGATELANDPSVGKNHAGYTITDKNTNAISKHMVPMITNTGNIFKNLLPSDKWLKLVIEYNKNTGALNFAIDTTQESLTLSQQIILTDPIIEISPTFHLNTTHPSTSNLKRAILVDDVKIKALSTSTLSTPIFNQNTDNDIITTIKPLNSEVTLFIPSSIKKQLKALKLLSVDGSLIKDLDFNKNEVIPIDTSILSKGIYFLSISWQDSKTTYKKIIKAN